MMPTDSRTMLLQKTPMLTSSLQHL
jgi:hypothetical protein